VSSPVRRPIALSVALALCACASGGVERPHAPDELAGFAAAFEADSTLHGDDGALYLAALAYGLPDSPSYSPGRAITLLEHLLNVHPRSRYAGEARHLHELLLELRRLDMLRTELAEQREALAAELTRERSHISDLWDRLREETTRADSHEAIATGLRREIERRDERIRQLEEELAALKEIDLNRPSTR
jgi:hypothetical protein